MQLRSWGNPEAYDTGTPEDKQLFYQHDCHWVYDHVTLANPDFGKIAVFNNRVPGENGDPYSSVHLLNPSYTDYDNTFGSNEGTYLPETFDWSYVPQDSLYSSGLSSFQRLENGNSLICFGSWGDTREITPDGELAWRYKTPLMNLGGFAIPVVQGTPLSTFQNLTFRAHRYPATFPAFDGAMLEPQGTLELNPTPLVTCGCDQIEGGECDCSGNQLDAVGLCGGTCQADLDADGICDDVDSCIGAFDVCGVCNGPGEVNDCGCTDIPAEDCDCEGSQIDVIGICGGQCQADSDNNGVCDDQEVYGCTYPLAENFSSSVTRDDGSCIFPCEGAVNVNVFDWDEDYAVTIADFLAMLSVFGDVDVDSDGIWDSSDLCVDINACNYANDPSEPCGYIDVLGICGGGCEADEDNDGICDDIDSCIGVEDECGVCNGPGPTEVVIEDITILYDSVYLPQLEEWYVYEFGADTTFSYECAPFFGDCGDPVSYQGYVYSTVLVGDQCWFAENLRSEHYENGDAIPASLDADEWLSTTAGAAVVYDGDDSYEEAYGRLYNWYTVDDVRGLCPSGWHVPTDEEWTVMTDHLGGETVAGGQMKSTFGWSSGGNGTNSSGFSGLPGGYRNVGLYSAGFSGAGEFGSWWSSSLDGLEAWARDLYYGNESISRYNDVPRFGMSVRCIQNTE